MSLYTKLVSNVLFPLHEKLKKHDTVRIKESLEKSQWLPLEQLNAMQAKRLQTFVEHLYINVEYYRSVMDQQGLTPADIQSVNDLSKLPFLTKALIQDNYQGLKSKTSGPVNRFNTGGSSGQPLVFLLGNERVSHDVAEKWRATRWWDVVAC